jgi:hypothetical protein
MGGLYTSEISSFRIMADEDKLTRFIRGEWPGSFRLDRLSLYDFMSTSHQWFDYVNSSRDTLQAFRNFIKFLTWVFGDHWANSFSDEIANWESKDPWYQCEPWVLHLSLDKAISSWITDCHSDASWFCYKSVETSCVLLDNALVKFMAAGKLSQLEKSYNRSLSAEVVYPNSNCIVPLGIPSIRHSPKFGSSQLKSVSAPKTFESSSLSSKDHPKPKDLSNKEDRSASSSKRPLGNDSGKSESKVLKTAGSKYCHANLAHVFGFAMANQYGGPCKDPKSAVSCSCGLHSITKELPSVSVVIQSIEDIKSKRSAFCDELLEALKNHQE